MEIIKLILLFVGMYFAADFVRRQTYSMTLGITQPVVRQLANSVLWALGATVSGVVISLVLGMSAPPFLTWLIIFTAIDFIFGMMRR